MDDDNPEPGPSKGISSPSVNTKGLSINPVLRRYPPINVNGVFRGKNQFSGVRSKYRSGFTNQRQTQSHQTLRSDSGPNIPRHSGRSGGTVWSWVPDTQTFPRGINKQKSQKYQQNLEGVQAEGNPVRAQGQGPRCRNGARGQGPRCQNGARGQGGQIGRDDSRPRFLAFRTIEGLSILDPRDILASIATKRDGFNNLINSPVERQDVFVLLIKILSNVSQSPYAELKAKLILDVCNSNFISNLRNYLMDLPYTEKKSSNGLYWKDQNEFWKNFIIFCEDIFIISPSTATTKCRALIDSISKTCLEYLNQRHEFVLTQEYDSKLNVLRRKLTTYDENKQIEKKRFKIDEINEEPPDDFRNLSLLPSVEDIGGCKPFLRSNVVKGGYNNVQHYLDVQFRLLREDCFGPLREGIGQYMLDPTKRKYDHIRVFTNVKFICPYISNLKIGSLVQIDTESNHIIKRINWAHNKRFIFGSLVIFTKDNCKSFLLGTILDRDANLLSKGKLPVSIIHSNFGDSLYKDETYTMIESEVYFEPYYHVMKALQAPTFPQHLAMQQYIVHVDPTIKPPAYLTNDTEYKIKSNDTENLIKEVTSLEKKIPKLMDRIININNHDSDTESNDDESDGVDLLKYKVLQPESWPTKEELKLNDSQYEAFRLALTHEFAVIQGPPGTGKTYLGIQVAKTLLENIKLSSLNKRCLMLIVCYTNHALDQFFEAISKVTKSMVRFGGQSRNEAIEKFNINKLRNGRNFGSYFMEEKHQLRNSINDFQIILMLIDVLNNGVLNYDCLDEDIPEINLLVKFYSKIDSSIKDPLYHWLFEYKTEYYVDFHICLKEIETYLNDANVKDKARMLENDDESSNQNLDKLKKISSFSVAVVKHQLEREAIAYRKSKHFNARYEAQTAIQDLYAEMDLYNDMVNHRGTECNIRIQNTTNFSAIRMEHRWMLYFGWVENVLERLKAQAIELQVKVSPHIEAYDEARMMVDAQLIADNRIKVVGMTTSCAAKMRKLLEAISPKIVIVEEAAEVLEQHIITSLTKYCEHLILIGDHQQLRPSASYMKLARHYNIEVSLFERMITNGIHSRRLNVQHRMRPEIAELICPHIYPDLQNHSSVEYLGDVPGIENNVFFFSHDYQEEEGRLQDSTSRTNHREGDMTLALANYIVQQGYDPDDVTILTAYSGQMFYMRKERINYAALSRVKITVVDNYQGEESKIILLSLVRNNAENKIGFLGTANRICVALSRAKQGFYIFGNIDSLKLKSELWQKIAATLESRGSVGNTLKLKCQNHPDQKTDICNITDFQKVPEGGCLSICNFEYSCSHRCLLFCHGYDREHNITKCTKKCERVICELEHICPLKCSQECQPCKVLLQKTLPCTHKMKVPCHLEPDDPEVKCVTKVEITLPDCGHKAEKPCYLDIKDVKCLERCVFRLAKCGHVCNKFCHVNYDPEHEKYVCIKPCSRAKKGCTAELVGDRGDHQCKKPCNEECSDCYVMVKKKRSTCKHVETVECCKDLATVPCNKKCARIMECGHYCKKKCCDKCGDCKQMVVKEIPDCKHKIKIECMTTPSRDHCTMKCTRPLPCGHRCQLSCREICDPSRCNAISDREVPSPCGHKVKLPCNLIIAYDQGKVKADDLLKYCRQPCGVELSCKHLCGGSCAACHQGRLHAPCSQTCGRPNICGHECQEPCNQICPPCGKTCEVKCPHSLCQNMCGEPCTPCQEKCSRNCIHGSCLRRCSEPCDRAACGSACPLRLACGHACRGLCGEPCPDICRLCRPDDFPKGFLGEEYGDEDKFIVLQDCGHIMELENMDNLMLGDQEMIKIRTCPFCRKPIINTVRYKDAVNNSFKNKINPIKTKVYGTPEQIAAKKREFVKKFTDMQRKYASVYRGHLLMNNTICTLITFVNKHKQMFVLEIEMLIIYLNIFEMISECCAKYDRLKPDERLLDTEIQNHIKLLLSALKIPVNTMRSKLQSPIKISEQQQKDLNVEIKRLNVLVQFSQMLILAKTLRSEAPVEEQTNHTSAIVLSLTPFDEDKAIESMQILQKLIKQSGHISKYERDLVIKAIGLSAGHWYECPNGHLYCIGDCGRAVQDSKCPDCGSRIGGAGYVLAPGNSRSMKLR